MSQIKGLDQHPFETPHLSQERHRPGSSPLIWRLKSSLKTSNLLEILAVTNYIESY